MQIAYTTLMELKSYRFRFTRKDVETVETTYSVLAEVDAASLAEAKQCIADNEFDVTVLDLKQLEQEVLETESVSVDTDMMQDVSGDRLKYTVVGFYPDTNQSYVSNFDATSSRDAADQAIAEANEDILVIDPEDTNPVGLEIVAIFHGEPSEASLL